jgi:DNA-binding transcriptional MerR regulator
MTIHELANFTGCTIRTLHYYDKIGLLKPNDKDLNGYRKYNKDSLMRLQQIMFYKEMDLPLKTIKYIMNQPNFDRKEAIEEQKELLIAKRNRLSRLIQQMEQILKGDDIMDFTIFEHNELEDVLRNRMLQLDEEYQQDLIKQYGSLEDCIQSIMKNEDKVRESAIEHFGSLKKYIDSLKQAPFPKKSMAEMQARLDEIIKQIATYHSQNDVSLPEIQKLVSEWKIAFQQMIQMEDITEIFRQMYRGYKENSDIIKAMNDIYGKGVTEFIGRAMEYHDKYQM